MTLQTFANNESGASVRSKINGNFTDLAGSGGAGEIGFLQAGTGAVARTAQAKFRDSVSILDFGAVSGGSGSANRAALQAAINTGKRVLVPNGTYALDNTSIDIANPTFIEGESKQAVITLPASASADTFRIASSNVMFKDLVFQGNGSQTNCLFRLRSSVGSYEMFFFENIETEQCHHFLMDDNSTGVLTLCYVENCFHRQPTGRGIQFFDMFAYLFADRFTVDYVGVTAPSSNVPAISVTTGQGCRFTNVDVLGGTIAGFGSRRGFNFDTCEAVWLTKCMADTMGGEGVYFNNCDGVYLTDVTGSLCNLHQIVLNDCNNVIAKGLYAGGRNALSGTANQDGVRISGGGVALAVSTVFSALNTGHGLNITGTGTSALVTGLTSRLNTLRGYNAVGLSSVLSGAQFSSNTAGNYNLGGTFDHIVGAQLNSGALVVNATGAAAA